MVETFGLSLVGIGDTKRYHRESVYDGKGNGNNEITAWLLSFR